MSGKAEATIQDVLAAVQGAEARTIQAVQQLRAETLQAVQQLRAESKADITEVRVALMDRMDRFDAALSQVKDEITVNLARANRSMAGADAAREEIRHLSEEMSGVWRLVRRLQGQVEELREGKTPG